ncbi:MAG: ParB/RepB/Spo0J family partition protein [Lachnospiraceae bacterium]|nr:ParB/RepB/Spo0J family partition protein [Lachnospiraceae bacterium]
MAKRTGLGRGVEAFYGGTGSATSSQKEASTKIEAEEKKAPAKKAGKAGDTKESAEAKKASGTKSTTSKSADSKGSDAKTAETKESTAKGTASKSISAKGTASKSVTAKVTSDKAASGKATSDKGTSEKADSEKKDVPEKTSAEKSSDAAEKSPIIKEETKTATDGLHALDPRDTDIVAMVKLSKIEPNRDQPRKDFEEEGLQELAESIRNHGLIQPILVRPVGDHYEIVAGERRWRASRLAGLRDVPVIIRKDYTDADVAEIALVENLQRKDLNPVEEAMAYQVLIDEYHLTQEEVAFRVSKKRSSITNSLRLLKLHPNVQEMLQSNTISMGHAKVLLSLDTTDQQLMVALMIAQDDLSVRQTEQKVHEILNPKQEKPKKTLPDQLIYQDLENRLGSSVNSKVVIHRSNAKKGKIEISYTSLEELERIAELLGVKM